MGQKVNPISNRLGVIRGWDSNWYGGKKYGETLLEDSKIRKYLHTRLAKASVSRIIICLLYTSPSPRDPKTSRMPSSA